MDKMREAFEKWAKTECLDLDSIDGFYSDNDTHIAWGAWKAAKSAAVPVVGDVVAYDLSADYVKLLEFLKAGNDAAGFVTTDDYHNGDVVGVTRRGPYNIHIGVRGYSFASVYPFNSEDGSEEEVFIKACEFSRLKWIKPHHSISAAELERLQQNDVLLDFVVRKFHGLKTSTSEQFLWALGVDPEDVNALSLPEIIGAAIAGEKK